MVVREKLAMCGEQVREAGNNGCWGEVGGEASGMRRRGRRSHRWRLLGREAGGVRKIDRRSRRRRSRLFRLKSMAMASCWMKKESAKWRDGKWNRSNWSKIGGEGVSGMQKTGRRSRRRRARNRIEVASKLAIGWRKNRPNGEVGSQIELMKENQGKGSAFAKIERGKREKKKGERVFFFA